MRSGSPDMASVSCVPDPDRTISVRTFGEFELTFDDRPIERWRAGKSRCLLQFLLLRRGRVVPRAVLYESLWPDAPWSKDSSSLKVAAHMLRNILDSNQDQWPPGPGPSLRLITREAGYLLQAEGVSVDFESFAQLADRAQAAQARHHRATSPALYSQAVSLYRGDFLADVDYDWAATHREWLRSRLLHALTFLTETAILGRDHAGVIHWCKQMLDAEPLHEETYRALILVHGHLGQLSQVHRWYRLCETRLRDHLQVVPQLATQRLYAQAVRGEYTGRPIDPQAWRRELQPVGYPSLLQQRA